MTDVAVSYQCYVDRSRLLALTLAWMSTLPRLCLEMKRFPRYCNTHNEDIDYDDTNDKNVPILESDSAPHLFVRFVE